MAEFRVAGTTDAEIRRILAWSEANFGTPARVRYAVLIATAMADIAATPDNPLFSWHSISNTRLAFYHLRYSREHVPDPPGPRRRPTPRADLSRGARRTHRLHRDRA